MSCSLTAVLERLCKLCIQLDPQCLHSLCPVASPASGFSKCLLFASTTGLGTQISCLWPYKLLVGCCIILGQAWASAWFNPRV